MSGRRARHALGGLLGVDPLNRSGVERGLVGQLPGEPDIGLGDDVRDRREPLDFSMRHSDRRRPRFREAEFP